MVAGSRRRDGTGTKASNWTGTQACPYIKGGEGIGQETELYTSLPKQK